MSRQRRLRPAQRFWSKVNKDGPLSESCPHLGPCWIWLGRFHSEGYGTFGVNTRQVFAHRYSWELHNGPISAGLFVCHHCDVPSCSRPDHLFLGTHADNMADMKQKGRGQQGERHHSRKLTEVQVSALRLRRAGGEPAMSLASFYDIGLNQVYRIVRGDAWAHSFQSRERLGDDEH